MDYSIRELKEWNQRIEEIVGQIGLDCYLQEFEICSFEDMIGYQAYSGMPAHYPHWSYGKSYERTKTYYQYNLTGLPYEMVINSSPCLAYLMKDNSLVLQVLTMAHVYGHNDFFKNNRLFKEGTNADHTLAMFKNHANRIREYISNPGIGYERVERILDAAHALKLQTSRVVNEQKLTRAEQIKQMKRRYETPPREFQLLEDKESKELPNLDKIPLQPEEDILAFLIEYASLEDWEEDILQIVIDETKYFIPQIETKIMNEGWASYWHYQILQQLDLAQGMHLEFIKRHNQVIAPRQGSLNPYYLGYQIFNQIKDKYPNQPEKIFEARELERDESFIRKYLTFDLAKEMNLLKYDEKKKYYVISEVADEEGWKEIRNSLANSVGMNKIPVIKIMETSEKDHTLYLEHEYKGQELEAKYAKETLKYIADLWGGSVRLKTVLKEEPIQIICDENKKISSENI